MDKTNIFFNTILFLDYNIIIYLKKYFLKK